VTRTVLAVSAPAKLNLHLHVIGKRGDGYHELRTLYQSIDLTDEVRGSVRADRIIRLTTVPEGFVSAGEDNLVMRAARALREWSGNPLGADLELRKSIPVGSGLGGGSADAAATLVLLESLWDLDLEPEALRAIAAGLGSDVPYFLCGGLAWGTGRGDEVRPLPDLAEYAVLVCLPKVEVFTAEVFSDYVCGLTSHEVNATVSAFVAGRTNPPWECFFNDLEQVVTETWPEIGRALGALRATHPLHSGVTGSGAAVFGVFADARAALDAARDLGDNWRFHVGSTLGRAASRLVARRVETREEDRE
jgi:4-diphosphocytidyl-2-C-methyl-D-erythritol kinase